MKKFDIQFFSKNQRTILLFIFLMEVVSFMTFLFTPETMAMNYIFLILIGLVFAVSLINIRYGLFIVLIELLIGSKGYLFFYDYNDSSVSIRIGIFAIVMLTWVIWLIRTGSYMKIYDFFKKNVELVYLAGVLLMGLVSAIVFRNSLSNIFFDFNNWLFFLYMLPFVTVFCKQKHISEIMQIFVVGVSAVAIKSLVFLFLFSHPNGMLEQVYKWGRDTGFGEFTVIVGNLYRIFSQGQIFAIIGFFILIGYLIFKGNKTYRIKENKYLSSVVLILLTTIILSLSRSFWVGLIAGGVVLLVIGIIKYKFSIKEVLLIILKLGILIVISFTLITVIVNFPVGGTHFTDPTSLIKNRLDINESAISSRWSQLPELGKAIGQNPVFGSGWGTTVRYKSLDPRIVTEENPEGWYTTFAFEWGYLDFVLKIGIVGLFVYLFVLYRILYKLFLLWKNKQDHFYRALVIGLFLGLISLICVHGFTPYLNHPLGIGYIILCYVFIALLSTKELEV